MLRIAAVMVLGLGAGYCFKRGGLLGTLLGCMMTYDAASNLWKIANGEEGKDKKEDEEKHD